MALCGVLVKVDRRYQRPYLVRCSSCGKTIPMGADTVFIGHGDFHILHTELGYDALQRSEAGHGSYLLNAVSRTAY